MDRRFTVLTCALWALATLVAFVGAPVLAQTGWGTLRLGSNDARVVELAAGGTPFFRLSGTGLLSALNGGTVGEWTTPTFDAAEFTGNGTQTWTVAAGDVAAYGIHRVGDTVVVTWEIATGTVGGAANTQLRLGTYGLTWARTCNSTHTYIDGAATRGAGRAQAVSGTDFVVLMTAAAGNWAAATDTQFTAGQITCQVS